MLEHIFQYFNDFTGNAVGFVFLAVIIIIAATDTVLGSWGLGSS